MRFLAGLSLICCLLSTQLLPLICCMDTACYPVTAGSTAMASCCETCCETEQPPLCVLDELSTVQDLQTSAAPDLQLVRSPLSYDVPLFLAPVPAALLHDDEALQAAPVFQPDQDQVPAVAALAQLSCVRLLI